MVQFPQDVEKALEELVPDRLKADLSASLKELCDDDITLWMLASMFREMFEGKIMANELASALMWLDLDEGEPTAPDFRQFEELARTLKAREEDFINAVLGSGNQNFSLLNHYDFYALVADLIARRLGNAVWTSNFTAVKLWQVARYFMSRLGLPILAFMKTGEVPPCISFLTSVLLQVLKSEAHKFIRRDENSFWYYLFKKIHCEELKQCGDGNAPANS